MSIQDAYHINRASACGYAELMVSFPAIKRRQRKAADCLDTTEASCPQKEEEFGTLKQAPSNFQYTKLANLEDWFFRSELWKASTENHLSWKSWACTGQYWYQTTSNDCSSIMKTAYVKLFLVPGGRNIGNGGSWRGNWRGQLVKQNKIKSNRY